MARKKKKECMKDFIDYTIRNNMTYAQAQVRETLAEQKKIVVPPGYSKIGERKVLNDESKGFSSAGQQT